MKLDQKQYLLILLGILVVTFVPFLGDTLFNTKGEPREAIVAVSMLKSGNWILPESYGGDIPYKPPFLAWCIAIFSSLLGGEVTHFTSRLPSALAMIAMAVAIFKFYCRRTSPSIAFCTALVTLTAFEVHRAATACRVDMLLTASMVGSLFLLYDHYERGKRGISWWAVLTMSCAILTKGPVGMLLPCLVVGVFRLIRGERFFPVFASLAITGILALVIPAIWYVAAYHQGGDGFVSLAMEENFGRFIGKMGYDSHVRPIYYNFAMLVSGLLPYTLLLLLSLFTLRYRNPKRWGEYSLKKVWHGVCNMDPANLFSMVSAVIIFLFYCVPKSKRGVYLLPVYPFVAYFITLYIVRLVNKRSWSVKAFSAIVGTIAIILPLLFVAIRAGLPLTVGKSMALFLDGLRDMAMTPVRWLFLVLSLVAGVVALWRLARGVASHRESAYAAIFSIIALYWSYSAVYQPATLNAKSDLPVAHYIEETFGKLPIYSFIDDEYMRFFTVNYYLGDRIRCFDQTDPPSDGIVLVDDPDMEALDERYCDKYIFTEIYRSAIPSCDTRHTIRLLLFTSRQ